VISAGVYSLVAVVGLAVGSFLNVCIYRLPRKESISWGVSHCPGCSTPIKFRDNVPVLSYLLLKGRCRNCRCHISLRYPLVEVTNAIGYVVILWHFGRSWSTVIYMGLFSALLVVTYIDFSCRIIPDLITLPGIIIGLISASTVLPVGLLDAVLGVLLGGGILWALAWLSPYLFGKEGMGGGDIKLLAMIGAFLGWKPAILTMLIGAVLGSCVGVGLILFHAMRRDQYLPFGPFLALGALVAMFFHQEILHWYLNSGMP
jgi:leader peptidase (prepilin peptidase)/N-methyltransferase